MSGYTQTILLDANRLNSEEFNGSTLALGGNNAVFTNKVSSGITLDIGDKVSVQSAFISERGAGGSVIEFKGQPLDALKTIEYTNSVSTSFVGYGVSPTAFAYESSSLITEEIEVTDNEASFVIEYYKNSNGENYLTLPRNHASAGPTAAASVAGTAYHNFNASSDFYTREDGYGLGMIIHSQNSSHIYADDWHPIIHSYANSSNIAQGPTSQPRPRKLKNDNSKFTIFKQNEIVWDFNSVSSASATDYVRQPVNFYDPACHSYQIFKEKKTIGVDAGYDSPSNIASTITDQLIEADPPFSIEKIGLPQAGEGGTVVNASLYNAFPATSWSWFNASTLFEYCGGKAAIAFGNPVGFPEGVAGTAVNASAVYWGQAYAYVGFKRPKLVEQGRKTFAYHGNFILAMNASQTEIKTNISWDINVLDNIRKLFDIQHDIYPELIENGIDPVFTNYAQLHTATNGSNASSLSASLLFESRFLHMGGLQTAGFAAAPLGDDMYNVSYSGPNNSPPSGILDHSSKPLFLYFNNNCSHLSPLYWDGENDDQLAYGFARKNHVDDTITFVTERIGGVNASFMDIAGAPRTLTNETKIGYDYHFNAYGNAAIMLTNGIAPAAYYGTSTPSFENINSLTYLGANNAVLNFDTVQNRFQLQNLHTAEKVGNFYNAGDPDPGASVFAPPPSEQAGLDCYKINKVNSYATWSPSMRPYPTVDVNASGKSSGLKFSFMYEQYEIYDAHCGVNITDMGIDEKEWANSIWGILGFSYKQFNPKRDNILSINNRISNNTRNVSGTTTVASVVSSDSLNYPVNVFGIQMYLTSILTETSFNGSNYFPPTVVLATSTAITADDLPRKILRGYFLIESDILSDANYYLTSNPLQVIAVANKYSAETDFVNYEGSGGIQFTVTKKKVLTDIVTKIKDPDGSLAEVDSNSAVIYKIEKQINTDLNFAETIIQENQQKK
tara:strand:- start:344 stop:3208 length:2865 start_codon:yes stop_codon:yes gene_type:complete